jgi:hypothetical protein
MVKYLTGFLSDIRNVLRYIDDPKRMTVTENDYEKLTEILEALKPSEGKS